MAKMFGNANREGRIIPLTAISGTTAVPSGAYFLEDYNGISFQLITDGTVAGAWKIEVSNDYSVGFGDDRAFTGNWTDVTAAFVDAAGNPAIATVVSGGSSQATQAAPFMYRAYRVTFTPTSGAGNVYCAAFAKAYA